MTPNSETLGFLAGGGIAPDSVDSMFGLFEQGERGIDRAEGGLGVGLTVVKRLTEMHGGTVTGQSAGAGAGSVFTVSLPDATARKGADLDPAPEQTTTPLSPSHILVVDDNRDVAEGLAEMLKILGHEVQTVHDGLAALEQAQRSVPSVVLLDIGLPGLDGYQVARRLRANETTRDAKIIAITGYGQREDRQRSAEAGFDHHLVKPIDFDALVPLLNGV